MFAALAGFVFAATSTYDFVAHLDRQVHGLHCSFLPGIGPTDASGTSGCHATLMSPYSSIFRQSIWGGIPIALPAMGVFGFLFYWALHMWVRRRSWDRRAAGLLLAGWGLPLLATVVMGFISFVQLGAACKLCVGIYLSSLAGFAAAVVVWLGAGRGREAPQAPRPGPDDLDEQESVRPSRAASKPVTSWSAIAGAAALGALFVLVPLAVYAASAPDFSGYVGQCGELPNVSASRVSLVPVGGTPKGIRAIEILDPLCPACRAFEQRLEASGLSEELHRKAALFPLDNECNWMVSSAVHPGACAVSEAILCAEDNATLVLEWAFEHQEEIREAAAANPDAAQQMVVQAFPGLKGCVGSPRAGEQLNRSLRWAVANKLPVLTPQLYVGKLKLCDSDTDLGMDYALSRLVQRVKTGAAQSRLEGAEELGRGRMVQRQEVP